MFDDVDQFIGHCLFPVDPQGVPDLIEFAEIMDMYYVDIVRDSCILFTFIGDICQFIVHCLIT